MMFVKWAPGKYSAHERLWQHDMILVSYPRGVVTQYIYADIHETSFVYNIPLFVKSFCDSLQGTALSPPWSEKSLKTIGGSTKQVMHKRDFVMYKFKEYTVCCNMPSGPP